MEVDEHLLLKQLPGIYTDLEAYRTDWNVSMLSPPRKIYTSNIQPKNKH